MRNGRCFAYARTFSSICTTSSRVGATTSARVPRLRPVTDGSRELRQDRQNERRRFASAGLRDADEIVPGENVRDRRHLNRSRLGVTGFLHGFENFRGKVKGTKWHKPGTIASPGGNRTRYLGVWRYPLPVCIAQKASPCLIS